MLPLPVRLAIQHSSYVLRRFSARRIHQAALATPHNYPPLAKNPSNISTELERRVQALEEAAVAEVCLFFTLVLSTLIFIPAESRSGPPQLHRTGLALAL
jgi:hypothetical protein